MSASNPGHGLPRAQLAFVLAPHGPKHERLLTADEVQQQLAYGAGGRRLPDVELRIWKGTAGRD